MSKQKAAEQNDLFLTHARCHPELCLAPLLFRPLAPGQRKRDKLHVVHDINDDETVEFLGFEPLGANDLIVLLGLISLAGPRGSGLPPRPDNDIDNTLRQSLEARWQGRDAPAIKIDTSLRQIARITGAASSRGKAIELVKQSLKRLWAVSVIWNKNNHSEGYRLLSTYGVDQNTDGVCIALNPMVAQSIIGDCRHIRVQMHSVLELESSLAVLLHVNLAARVNMGKAKKFQINTLYGYLWPEEGVSKATRRQRKKRLNDALSELESIGWQCCLVGNKKNGQELYEITRGLC